MAKKSLSVLKRNRQNEKRHLRNKAAKSRIKTMAKRVNLAVEQKDKDLALSLLRQVVSIIDKATHKGIIQKNTARRRKSSLMGNIAAL